MNHLPIQLLAIPWFLSGLLTHIIIWKIKLPRRQVISLLILFAIFFIPGAIYFLIDAPLAAALQMALFYMAATLCYVGFYAAIEVDSPTLTLAWAVFCTGKEGLSEEGAAALLAKLPFVQSRLQGLLDDGLIRREGNRFVPAGKPHTGFRLILAFRNIYGSIPKGG